jgi:hypothetical protein
VTMQAASGAFDTGTGAVASTVVVSGLGFQPKAILFWWDGRTGSVTASGRASHARGFGAVTSTTQRWAVYSSSQDTPTTMVAKKAQRNDACVAVLTTTGALDGLLDLQSFDSNGFTLAVDDQFATSYRVHYLALGGSDITDAKAGTVTVANASGDQDFTDPGFRPDFLAISSAFQTTIDGTIGADSSITFGMASDILSAFATRQGTWAGGSNDAAATSATMSYAKSGEIIASLNGTASAIGNRASLTAWLSTGFRLNFVAAPGIAPVGCYLALKGGRYRVDGMLSSTTLNQTLSQTSQDIGTPVGLLLFSGCVAESVAGTGTTNDQWSIGSATSSTNRQAMAGMDQTAAATAVVSTGVWVDQVYANLSTTGTIEGTADFTSFDSDGFSLKQTDADTVAAYICYLIVGHSKVIDVAARLRVAVTNFKDTSARFRQQVTRYVDSSARLKLLITAYANAATRFRLVVTRWVDSGARFRQQVLSYVTTPLRLRLGLQAYSFVSTRTSLGLQAFKDIATRVRLRVTAYVTAGSRFLLRVTCWVDTQARVHLQVLRAVDSDALVRIGLQTYIFVATRLWLLVSTVTDAAVRIRVLVPATADTDGRLRLSVASVVDAGVRLALRVTGYAMAGTRLLIRGAIARDSDVLLRLLVSTVTDTAARVRLALPGYAVASARFLLSLPAIADATVRLKLAVAVVRDAAVRLRLVAPETIDAAVRLALQSARAADGDARLRLAVDALRFAITLVRLAIRAVVNVATRFSLAIGYLRDVYGRLRLLIALRRDAGARFRLQVQEEAEEELFPAGGGRPGPYARPPSRAFGWIFGSGFGILPRLRSEGYGLVGNALAGVADGRLPRLVARSLGSVFSPAIIGQGRLGQLGRFSASSRGLIGVPALIGVASGSFALHSEGRGHIGHAWLVRAQLEDQALILAELLQPTARQR